MKRRDFIKVSSAAGMMGLAGSACEALAKQALLSESRFDLHPFIKENPEAVFINLTSINNKGDKQGIYDSAYKLASEMFVKTTNGIGYPNSTKIICKPNWTCNSPVNLKDPLSDIGITTDLNFIEGFLVSLKNKGLQEIYLRECACPNTWESRGYTPMAQRNNFDLRDLSSKDFWDLEKDDLIFKKVDGVVFNEIGFMAPINAPHTFLINIAKFKSHQMGITASIKNLQGITGRKFHQFCGGHFDIFKTYDERYHPFFQPNYMEKVVEFQKKHLLAGIPRWKSRTDIPPYGGALFMEQWIQRMLDSFSVTPTSIW